MAKDKDEAEALDLAKKRKRDKGEDDRHSRHKKHKSKSARDPAENDDTRERLGGQTNGALVLVNGGKEDDNNATLAEASHGAAVNGTGEHSSAIDRPLWRVSEPMGGRMLDIDPIFSPDEQ
jgi:NET1-associated nuclear protein 1 (U3 small nucleolar RNA-associated protein 17)